MRKTAPHPALRLLLAALLSAGFSLGAAGVGRALADEATERAKEHNKIAKKLFNLGFFEAAAGEYEKAYEAKPVPTFLFNLAQCYKRMHEMAPPPGRNIERAIFYYKSFLQNAPDSPFRERVEEEIRQLERRLAELRRPPPFYKRWWFWTIVGVAVGGVAVGTALAVRPKDEQPYNATGGTFALPLRPEGGTR
jgi:tetratricopeptide (TPR) repeat protein